MPNCAIVHAISHFVLGRHSALQPLRSVRGAYAAVRMDRRPACALRGFRYIALIKPYLYADLMIALHKLMPLLVWLLSSPAVSSGRATVRVLQLIGEATLG